MKGIVSKVLIALGILLIIAAILWWAVGVPALVKFPDNLDLTLKYNGTQTLYVDETTGAQLATPLELDLKIQNKFVSLADEYSSDTAVVRETTSVTVMLPNGQAVPQPDVVSVYVFDRKDAKNIDDERAIYGQVVDPASGAILVPGVPANRADSYYIAMPFDLKKEAYSMWKNETSSAYDINFENEEEKEGLTLLNFKGGVTDAVVNDHFVALHELPTTMTVGALKAQIQAAAGVDLDALLASIAPSLTAEQQAQLAAITDATPIPLKYTYTTERKVGIEPKTGSIANDYETVETLSGAPDTDSDVFKGITQLLTGAAAANPALLQQLAPLQQMLSADAPKIFSISFSQEEASIKEVLKDNANNASASIDKINVAKIYIPWALLIVGAIILIIGLLTGGKPSEAAEE
ncbi:MAG: porin PorA family protein [Candidatus Geothermincolia bacterium]